MSPGPGGSRRDPWQALREDETSDRGFGPRPPGRHLAKHEGQMKQAVLAWAADAAQIPEAELVAADAVPTVGPTAAVTAGVARELVDDGSVEAFDAVVKVPGVQAGRMVPGAVLGPQ